MDFSKLNEPLWGEGFDEGLLDLLQKLFDPNYGGLQMEAMKWQNPGMQIRSDSQPQTLEEIMQSRHPGLMATQYRQSLNMFDDVEMPMGPRSLDDWLLRHMADRKVGNFRKKVKPGM